MQTRELTEFPNVVEMYEFHKERTGCGDVAAAILSLAEVIRRTPADLASSIENGLDAVSSFSVRLSGDPLWDASSRTEAPRQMPAPTPAVSNGTIHEVKPSASTVSTTTNGAKTSGKPNRVRTRTDRNHTGLQVLEDFMPAEERKRLAEFLESTGFHINEKHNGQELLTLVVHYVSRMRKTACTHSHIHTVLKKMGVATPSDLGARLRDVGRRLGYINASNGQDVQLTMKGENWVDIELPKRMAEPKEPGKK
ncbi:MAG: hypothetical protein KF787_03105 [Phycisphaeraceae bacterium]|nr:hypothetical protein [Phycisphaerae bacterium]MBX3391616.1 hypothetical protein [Phycisphaeraceae bacterium]